ncbi:PASTA domain-containing protein [Amycolatopsis australiensis]|uniref:PASTA domain-containing protein n=1 Tax=Amycolatopsis australiensis TaxID=546364 RepID=A0A1K1S0G5_9PSEU|nr:PASTA domain-containing protein [Amycolatopsis australiensis]SFW77658.1 PASTA domain-containing protein [Amycolatopsis australiensis]
MNRPIRLAAVLLLGAGLAACGPGRTGGPAPAPTRAGTTAAPATTSAALIKVPDVSGMNHQDAQDTMHRAGLHHLREVDGTGQGRMLVVDRNWVQTGQDPAAGTEVPPDTVITLTAVKYTDR